MSEAIRNVLDIDQVIGPRLDSRSIVVETHTPSGQVAIRLSAGAAASLGRALATALRASEGAELPRLLSADLPVPLPAKPSAKRLRALLRSACKSFLATRLEQAG